MLERQREGVAKAQGLGRYTGRKPTVAVQAERIKECHALGAKPAHIVNQLGMARSSVYRFLRLETAVA